MSDYSSHSYPKSSNDTIGNAMTLKICNPGLSSQCIGQVQDNQTRYRKYVGLDVITERMRHECRKVRIVTSPVLVGRSPPLGWSSKFSYYFLQHHNPHVFSAIKGIVYFQHIILHMYIYNKLYSSSPGRSTQPGDHGGNQVPRFDQL